MRCIEKLIRYQPTVTWQARARSHHIPMYFPIWPGSLSPPWAQAQSRGTTGVSIRPAMTVTVTASLWSIRPWTMYTLARWKLASRQHTHWSPDQRRAHFLGPSMEGLACRLRHAMIRSAARSTCVPRRRINVTSSSAVVKHSDSTDRGGGSAIVTSQCLAKVNRGGLKVEG